MKFPLTILALLGGCFISCERHEFEGPNGTKQLNQPHGSHAAPGHGDGAAHHDKEKAHTPAHP